MIATTEAGALPVARARLHTGSFLALVAGAVAIGFAPIFVRLSEVGPVSTAFWRLLLALPALWSLAALESRLTGNAAGVVLPASGEASKPRSLWAMTTVTGLLFAADLAVWHWSIHYTSVANATLLANFAPIFVVLFGWFAFRKRVSRRFVVAMLVALAGTTLLVGGDFRLDPRVLLGDALGLTTAVFYAGYLLSVKNLRERCPTFTIMARSGVVTVAALLPIALVSGEKLLPDTAAGWRVLLALALVSHVGGQSLIAFALAKLPAPVASVSLLVQPVTAMAAAASMLGEKVVPLQLLGVVLVLAGVFVARQEGS